MSLALRQAGHETDNLPLQFARQSSEAALQFVQGFQAGFGVRVGQRVRLGAAGEQGQILSAHLAEDAGEQGGQEDDEPFRIDLLLTDIVMPEMDGIELARRATELDPDLKIMFITGFAAVALNPDSQAPKDAKVLSKPFHLKDLVREVEKMLAAA